MQRVVLVTGGTMGIGLALAEAFIARGDSVAVCGRSAEALDAFSRAHPGALAIRADVTNTEDRGAMLDAVGDRFGRLDILVNNAGNFVERDFREATGAIDGLEEEVRLNLTAPIQLTGEVLVRWPAIGALVFVTSGFALVPPNRAPTYGAVKAGLHAFTEALRGQLAAQGTHILELLPPTVDTQMNAGLNRKKMAPAAVAALTMKALADRRSMALPGDTRLLPTMLRLTPKMMRRMISKL